MEDNNMSIKGWVEVKYKAEGSCAGGLAGFFVDALKGLRIVDTLGIPGLDPEVVILIDSIYNEDGRRINVAVELTLDHTHEEFREILRKAL